MLGAKRDSEKGSWHRFFLFKVATSKVISTFFETDISMHRHIFFYLLTNIMQILNCFMFLTPFLRSINAL